MTDGNPLLRAADGLEPEAAAGFPLAVDLDGTLLRTDTLFEAIAEHMRTRALWTLMQMARLPFSIAATKVRLQQSVDIDVETLPVNDDVAAYCAEARAAGREVWLVTAADQKVADLAAARFDFLHGAIGSDGQVNNKGSAKARRLKERFPEGFEYIGDSPADRKVWKHAAAASHVGGGEGLKQTISRDGVTVARSFDSGVGGLKAWTKALRPHQWAKNLLIFVAPLLAMQMTHVPVMVNCAIAVLLVSIMASGTYILNDLLDLRADRRHASKQKRPFAAGRIKLWQGFTAAPLMICAALIGGAFLPAPFLTTMISYLVITLSYSLFLKRIPLLDTMLLGFLYTLRLIMGGVIAGVPLTSWFLVFSMFLFVSLSLAKRHTEILRKIGEGVTVIANRGYRAADAGLTLALGLACATICPVILVLYIIDDTAPFAQFASAGALWVAPVILSLWLMRVWLLANRGELDDDPVVFAIKDPISIGLSIILLISFSIGVFGLPAPLLEAKRIVLEGIWR
jgi:4-hydroxybenzoate polyprenyltransferase